MLELEYGEVKSFDPARGYGFLDVLDDQGEKTGRPLFFHNADGRHVGIREDEIVFAGRHSPRTHEPLEKPEVGDVLAFQRGSGRNGLSRAKPWTPAEGYRELVKEMSS